MQYSIVLNALKLKYEVFFKGKMRRNNLTFLWTCHKQTYAIVINKHMQSFKSPFTVHKYLWTFEGFESYHTSFSKALKAIIQIFSKALKAIIQLLRMLWKLFFRVFFILEINSPSGFLWFHNVVWSIPRLSGIT
jgi:hypothetical protein